MRIFSAAKISNATLLIAANDFGDGCGRSCTLKKSIFNAWPMRRSDGKRMLVTSLSRQDTVAAYQAADLFLFPSNIECSPLVLFECMASRTPFLATDVGNSAEIVDWSGGGKLLPTRKDKKGRSIAQIEGAAHMLAEMCIDKSIREQMAVNGFSAWQDRFTWSKIAREYESLYFRLLQGNGP
jgi:glycosyltransferase involved in cell wall biosynthesis